MQGLMTCSQSAGTSEYSLWKDKTGLPSGLLPAWVARVAWVTELMVL